MRKLGVTDWLFALIAVVIVGAGGVMLFGTSAPPMQHQNMGAVVPASHSDGLSEAEGDYRIERVAVPAERGASVPIAFRILGRDAEPVTRFLDNQTKQMHFFVVRDDMHVFRHVHPLLEGDTWRTAVDLPDGGAYRMFAEFVPLDTKDPLHPVVLGVPFSLAGDTALVPVPAPDARAVTETGYTVTRVDQPAALPLLAERSIRLAIRTPDGTPVERLEPHLGSNGHMTGFHTMLLSATHLHPVEPAGAPLIDGELTFRSVFAERGEYRLFLEFSHGGRLHTAALTVAVQ
ncbi:hypothetical protein [Lentzea sp. NBRC 102530]|uniref:hypothetical protein n=1 Tax=Lentzea sp. NBRC 102530 TaxID=3032201 RepID=UPI0024A49D63|nr:hypothetical protein [Lentzea sp. NBRC 102530]GLY47664.1 hypothetical protein Lesp01_13200 [Lentzea sp. NBRC 102530]